MIRDIDLGVQVVCGLAGVVYQKGAQLFDIHGLPTMFSLKQTRVLHPGLVLSFNSGSTKMKVIEVKINQVLSVQKI